VIVLDTNVLSELMRPAPSAAVARWVERQPSLELFTTAITQAEIFYGIELVGKGKRRDELLAAADAMFADDLAAHILSFDGEAARAYANLAARHRAKGKPISQSDAQIAAIALVHRAALATRNVRDFEQCGLRLIDPWQD